MADKTLLWIAVLYILTGVYMFVLPLQFYHLVPGVEMLGPYNSHFIRDAALSFGASGLILGLGWRRGDYLLCVAGVLWPAFHAVFHLQMWMARGFSVDLVAVVNFVGIQLPAWAALWAALWGLRGKGGELSQ